MSNEALFTLGIKMYLGHRWTALNIAVVAPKTRDTNVLNTVCSDARQLRQHFDVSIKGEVRQSSSFVVWRSVNVYFLHVDAVAVSQQIKAYVK